MNIDRIPDVRPDTAETPVTVKRCGNVIEVRYMRSTPCAVIEKVSADLYVESGLAKSKSSAIQQTAQTAKPVLHNRSASCAT